MTKALIATCIVCLIVSALSLVVAAILVAKCYAPTPAEPPVIERTR